MPTITTRDKVEIRFYIPYETFCAIEEARSPKTPRAAYCSMVMQEIFTPGL